jgi:hypothetical protein
MKIYAITFILLMLYACTSRNSDCIQLNKDIKEKIKQNLNIQLMDFLLLYNKDNLNLKEAHKYVPDAWIKYTHKINPYMSANDIDDFLVKSIMKIRSNLRSNNLGNIKFKISILGDGIFFNAAYFFVVDVQAIFENKCNLTIPDDILLAISDDQGENWKHLSISSETPSILKTVFSSEIVEKVYEYIDKIYEIDQMKVDSIVKKQVNDYYQSMFKCDSLKITSYLTDAEMNSQIGIDGNDSSIEKITQIINQFRGLKNRIEKHNYIINYKFNDILKRVKENNKLFYILRGTIISVTNNKSKTLTILAISENNGESWKFLDSFSTNREYSKQVLSTRYSTEVINELFN